MEDVHYVKINKNLLRCRAECIMGNVFSESYSPWPTAETKKTNRIKNQQECSSCSLIVMQRKFYISTFGIFLDGL
jgi:hypothetical protein